MEQVLENIVTIGHVLMAGLFALVPGTIVWLVVLGAFLAIRKVADSDLYRRLRPGAAAA
jgi:hypothetical protein